MESRTFIRTSQILVEAINEFRNAHLSHEEELAQGTALQKEINATLAGLQNPTLTSAERLMDAANAAGFAVNPQVQHRIRQALGVWPQV